MTSAPVLHSLDSRGVATVTLNRPEVGNAYNGDLIQGLLGAMDELGAQPGLRALLLRGNGKHFQAGADLNWIGSVSRASAEENVRVSRATAEAVDRLNRLPVPTIALVQGGCFGGGTGIVAACDVVIAADNAIFSIAEVRWGLTAAIIIPQLSDAISRAPAAPLCADRRALRRRRGAAHRPRPPGRAARPPGGRRRGDDRAASSRTGPWRWPRPRRWRCSRPGAASMPRRCDALVDSHAAKRRSPEAAEGLASFAEKRAARWSRG